MIQPKRTKRLDFRAFGLEIAVPERAADSIARSAIYRRLLRPLARRGEVLLAGSAGAGGNGAAPAAEAAQPPAQVRESAKARRIRSRIAGLEWYQSIPLGEGVVTPGVVDHRDQLDEYRIPASLAGLRCLDVATWDGFWAFEMERRGAAEVVALDVGRWADCDIPTVLLEHALQLGGDRTTGDGFRAAHEILGSKVRREICNVYDLSPERFGKFDLVFVSDLLLHLRDPVRALERIFSVCSRAVLVADVYDPALEPFDDQCVSRFTGGIGSQAFFWWRPSSATLKKMMLVAGFDPVDELSRFVLRARFSEPVHKIALRGSVPEVHPWQALLRNADADMKQSSGEPLAGLEEVD